MTGHSKCRLCNRELARTLFLLAKLAPAHVNGYFTTEHEADDYRGRLWLLERPSRQFACTISKEWMEAAMPNLEAAAEGLARRVVAMVGGG